MTNLKLTIEGDASTLAMVLASLGDVEIATDYAVNPTPPATDAPVSPTLPPPNAETLAPKQPDLVMPVMTPAPAVPAVPTTDTPELDADGLPWDERIHSSSKKKKNDGTWTRRKGVDKDAIPAIEAELKASVAAADGQGHTLAPAPPEAVVVPETPFPIPNGPTNPTVPTPMPEMAAPVQQPAVAPVAPVQQPAVAPVAPVQQPAIAAPPPVAPEPVAPVQQPAIAPEPVAPAQQPVATSAMNGAQFMQHLTGKMAEKDAEGQPLVHMDYLNGLVQEIAGQFSTELKVITDIFTNQDMINYAIGALQRDGRW